MKATQKIFFIAISLLFLVYSGCKKTDSNSRNNGYSKDCSYPSVQHDYSGKNYMFIPEKNQAMLSRESKYALPYSFEKQTKEEEKWLVFSDRADNKSYTEPGGNTVHRNIDFLEVFLVADSCKDWLRIVKIDKKKISDIGDHFPDEITKDDDYGWIPKGQLLCWQSAVKSQETRTNLKVLTINTIESAQKGITEVEQVRFCLDPSLESETGSTTPMYRTYYLYKCEGDAFLVGLKPDITAYNAREYIKGWVDRSRFIIWENRLALEQNWENAAERKSKEVRAKFFSDSYMAENYQNGKNVDRIVIWQEESISPNRMKGNRFRFPVFTFDESSGIVHAGVVGHIYSIDGTDIDDKALDLRETIEQIKQSIRNINILFILDCTLSMEEYIPRVAQAISSKIKFLSNDAENNIKFSVFGYRDKVNGFGDTKTIVNPGFSFTNDYKQVELFLHSIETPNTADGNAEQMYRGIEEALKYNRLEEKGDNTNIVVLVGDAGNHKNANNENLIDLFSKANCHLLAFQVGHKKNILEDGVNPYDDFIEQVKDIALKSANKRVEIIKSKYKLCNTDYSTKFVVSNGIYELTNSPLRSFIYESPKGGSRTGKDLEDAIGKIILSANRFATELTSTLDKGSYEGFNGPCFDVKSGDDIFGGPLNPVIWNILAQREIDENTINNLMLTEKYQLLFPSYSTLKQNNASDTISLFKYCLFIQKRDLSNLINNMRTLTYETDKRKGLYDAYKKLLSNQIGEDVARNYKNPKDITYLLFGIPSQCRIFKGIPNIEYLLDPHKINDDAIDNYWSHIENAIKKLSAILNDRDDCPKMQVDNDVFYWIPQDYLP